MVLLLAKPLEMVLIVPRGGDQLGCRQCRHVVVLGDWVELCDDRGEYCVGDVGYRFVMDVGVRLCGKTAKVANAN